MRKGGDKPRPYGFLCRGGVYPRPCELEFCRRLSCQLTAERPQLKADRSMVFLLPCC